MKNTVGAVMILGAALLACKDSKPAASCDARSDPDKEFCFEYPKGQATEGEKVCQDFKGKWSATSGCDRQSSLGGCMMSTGINKWFYSGTKFTTAEAAKAQCYDKWVGPDGK